MEGKRHGSAKPISEIVVRQIAYQLSIGKRPDEIATMYGISVGSVYSIRSGALHSSITGIIPNPSKGIKYRRLNQGERAKIIRLASEGASACEIEAILKRDTPESPPGYDAIAACVRKAKASGQIPKQPTRQGRPLGKGRLKPMSASFEALLKAAGEHSKYQGKMTTREMRSVVGYVLDQVRKANEE